MTDKDKGVFDTVTRTFKRISFSSSKERTITDDCLVMMNVPSFMARRDASYEWASYLLKNLLNLPREKRFELYNSVLILLAICCDSNRSIVIIKRQPEKKSFDFISDYLVLLVDAVKTAFGLMTYETKFFRGEHKVDNKITKEQNQMREESFRASELSIYRLIVTLMETGEPVFKECRELHLSSLSSENMSRYDKSLKEFEKLYKGYGADVISSKRK